ncbi:MAG: glycosyltransferase [Acidobacteria bacterium]|nr:MAG: glycosyltransferase [Acidobacteriota bacterium]
MNDRARLSHPLFLPGLALLALASLVLHLLTLEGYGFFRDEFYFVACSRRLAFGFVDHPPLSAALLAGIRLVLGDSFLSVRLLPILAGISTIFTAGLIARELGGGKYAQLLAGVPVLIAPLFLFSFHFFSMNPFDILLWSLAALVVIRIIRTSDERLWLLFGVIAGLGLMNKISMLFLGVGLVVGLLLTRQRIQFLSGWFWAGGAIAGLLFIPHVAWQTNHGWPTLEFMDNALKYKMLALSPPAFFSQLVLEMNPFTLPLWLAGLYYFFFDREGRHLRLFGWAYLAILILFVVQGAKPYYFGPIYPLLFAAGAVLLERLLASRLLLKAMIIVFLLAGGAVAAPLALPLLAPETYIRYSSSLGMEPSSGERHEMGRLPQHFADMFGWEEMVTGVARVYHSLPDADKKQCGIFGRNYGEAGAIDLLGNSHGLPDAISGHNNYWLWGPDGYTGNVLIVIGGKQKDLARYFDSVLAAGIVSNQYSMPYENNLTIWVARGMKKPLKEVWPRLKSFN